MMNQFSPETQLMLYRERTKELERTIQQRLALQEMQAEETEQAKKNGKKLAARPSTPWYLVLVEWLHEENQYHAA